jgi:hypothetical protein
VLLTYAQQAGAIGNVEIAHNGPFMLRWMDLPAEDKEAFLGWRRPEEKHLKTALHLAGTTLEEARAARLDESPEAKKEARRNVGV